MNKVKKLKKYIISMALTVGMAMPFVMPVMEEAISVSSANSVFTTDIKDLTFKKDGTDIVFTGGASGGDPTKALENAIKFIKWISTGGAVLLLGVFIVNLLKIGASGTNAQTRAAAQQGLIWSGVATAALSISSTIFFFLQAALK